MKSASQSVEKWQGRAGAASTDYLEGAQKTDKDQAARAIAAKEIYKSELTASFGRDSYAKGLSKSGKAGWIKGVVEKGGQNYSTGVTTESARQKYVAESGKYDGARNASANMPKGVRGSAQNLNKVVAVANALHAVKVG